MRTIDVVCAILEKNNTFLIAQRKKGMHQEYKWEFPGGKIESGETPEECLTRELKEEFNISAKITDFVAESIFDYGDRVVRLLGYRAEYISGEFLLNDHEEIKWISRDEFSRFDFAQADLPLVEKILMT